MKIALSPENASPAPPDAEMYPEDVSLAARRAALIKTDYDAIPFELRERRQWVGMSLEWRITEAGYKFHKQPKRPDSGMNADTSDPQSCSGFDDAVAARERYHFDGIGYVATADDPCAFVVLDDCIDKRSGVVAPEVMDVVRWFSSYTERSCSGTGLHVVVRGKVPGPRNRGQLHGFGVAMYESGQYMVMTGSRLSLSGTTQISDAQPALDELYASLFGR